MGIYARETDVPADRSKAEIEAILRRYGADQFVSGWKTGQAVIGFVMRDRQIRFTLPLPVLSDFEFVGTRKRNKDQMNSAYNQAIRQLWRALALAIKAKLESVESGISSFEREFLANIVMPNGETAGDWLVPQITEAYQSKKMPPLLLGAG